MLRVLSIDIGTVNYTCCAVNFSESDDLKAKCSHVLLGGRRYASVELIDIFNVNIGAHVKGLNALDVLISAWDELALFQAWKPDVVLIEQQFKKAVVNYSLSITTYTLAKRSFPWCSVRFVRPLSKFAGYKRFFPVLGESYPLGTYKQRKTAAILLSTTVLQEFFGIASLADYWRSEGFDTKATKLDDCADAFLQIFCV